MEKHIKSEGWHNWEKTDAEETAFYGEYKSIGDGANSVKRVLWSHQLKKRQAKKYTKKNIFESFNSDLNKEWYSGIN